MKSSRTLAITAFAFFGIYVVWGTTFLAIKVALKDFPPFLLAATRFSIAGTLLMGYAVLKGDKPCILRDWKRNVVVGALVLTGGTGLLTWAEQYVSSTEACVIEAAGPFLFIAFDRANWSYYFSKKTIITGLVIGFSGVLFFLHGSMAIGSEGNRAMKSVGIIVIVISVINWVSGSLVAKSWASSNSIIMNVSQQLLSAGILSSIISTLTLEKTNFNVTDISWTGWASLGYLIVFGSIVAYICYQYLLSTQKPVVVSTHTYINPLVAMLVGWLFAEESTSLTQWIGLVVILAGVFMINMDEYKTLKKTWLNTPSKPAAGRNHLSRPSKPIAVTRIGGTTPERRESDHLA